MKSIQVIYQLPPINYLSLRLHLTAENDTILPALKGSVFRGAFGHALRKTVCAMGANASCQKCMLKNECVYTRLFETFISGPPPRFLRGLDTAPRPFIFSTLDLNQKFSAGSSLIFGLTLIGSAIELLPFVIFAIWQMAQNGLGASREPFQLHQVECFQPQTTAENSTLPPSNSSFLTESDNPVRWKQLYDAADQTLLFTPNPTPIPNGQAPITGNECRLKFLTPTRLKFKGKYDLQFSFRHLVFKMLRRVLELGYFHEPDANINWEFHDLLVAADKVEIIERNLRWFDWQRYSNRQQTKIKMGGFVGDILLSGELAPFWDLLRYAEILHVGKGCVFGLGKVEISSEKNEIK